MHALGHAVNRKNRFATKSARGTSDEAVSLRLGRVSDDLILEQLAELEGRELRDAFHVVAEVHGEVVAALPLAGGEPLADPFRKTSHLLPLMRQYATTIMPPRNRRLLAGLTHHFA